MQQFTNIEEAQKEAEYIYGSGDLMYSQYIFQTPEKTFYIVSERRYYHVPAEDKAVAVIGNWGWVNLEWMNL